MRYSTAFVLSTLAVGQAAAHTIRHAGFHARRHEEAKRGDGVDYSKVDYSGVDWTKVDWDAVFSLKNKQPVATPAPEPEYKAPKPTPEPKKPTKPKEEAPAPTEEEKKPEKTKEPEKPSLGDKIGDILEGIADGVEDFCKKKGIGMPGKNEKKPNGAIWLGHSDWTANFHNGGNKDVWVACWTESGFKGMTINVNQPWILAKIPVGANQTVSFAPKVAAACAPMYPDTPLANFGGVYNVWFEANYGPTDDSFVGTFDISKNTRMHGDSISAVGSKCVSDMHTCVYECQDKSVDSCTYGYELKNCQAGNGGGQGYDVVMQGVGGGCNMGATSEHIEVTFSNKN